MATKKKKFNFSSLTPGEVDFLVQNYVTKSGTLNRQSLLATQNKDKKSAKAFKKKGEEWEDKANELFEAYVEYLEGELIKK